MRDLRGERAAVDVDGGLGAIADLTFSTHPKGFTAPLAIHRVTGIVDGLQLRRPEDDPSLVELRQPLPVHL